MQENKCGAMLVQLFFEHKSFYYWIWQNHFLHIITVIGHGRKLNKDHKLTIPFHTSKF